MTNDDENNTIIAKKMAFILFFMSFNFLLFYVLYYRKIKLFLF